MPTWGISKDWTPAQRAFWKQCEKKVAAVMAAAGWKPYAKKYKDTHNRRTAQLFRQRVAC